VPVELEYNIDYMLVRHRRTENSPAHNWLWAQILELLGELQNLGDFQLPGAGPGS
jgi:hypothetical protein